MIESLEDEYRKNLIWWHETDENHIQNAVNDIEESCDNIIDSGDINMYWVEQYKQNPCVSGIPDFVRDFCRDIYNTYPTISSNAALRLWLLRCSIE